MKKTLLIALFVFLVFPAISVKAETVENIFRVEINTDSLEGTDFLYVEENVPYHEGMNSIVYRTSNYEIERYSNFITIAPYDDNGTMYDYQIIDGYHFVVCQEQIWFINDFRHICSFDYVRFEYTGKDDHDYFKSDCFTLYRENVDLRGLHLEDLNGEFHSERAIETDGKSVVFTHGQCTLLFSGNIVATYSVEHMRLKGNTLVKDEFFPFGFKEVGLVYNDSYSECALYQFISDNGTVGTITVDSMGNFSYDIYAEGPAERHLFKATEQNGIDIIHLRKGYIIYYEDGHLIGSNGKISFNFDDFEYERMYKGNAAGVGKGFENCFFMADLNSDPQELTIEEMLEKTGLNY